jgi:hypothetical protein
VKANTAIPKKGWWYTPQLEDVEEVECGIGGVL